MQLNTLSPTPGSKRTAKRVGRGIGSTLGKTAGRGHKGQHSRSGGYHKVGFEGGQMPLQRRIPKFGFNSRKALTHTKLRLDALNYLSSDVASLPQLIKDGIVNKNTKTVKIYLSGTLNKAITVQGIAVSKGAVEAIKDQGGKVEQ